MDNTKQTEPSALENHAVKSEPPATGRYYIQVASFKDPEIGYKTFLKITGSYPDAYLFKHDDFYKIRIPDIHVHADGVALIKEIEERFNIRSMLVTRTN